MLMEYDWPGNIRELQNLIERAVILSRGPVLSLEPGLLPKTTPVRPAVDSVQPSAASETTKDLDPAEEVSLLDTPMSTLEEIARKHVQDALKRCGGVIEGPKGAAKGLGLRPSTLRSRIAKLGIDRKSFKGP